jgi:hypothetical protein
LSRGFKTFCDCFRSYLLSIDFEGISFKPAIDDSPYYVFVALCIVMVIVVSLIKIAASNENIECFREYFAVGYRAPDPSFFNLRSRLYAVDVLTVGC